MLIFVLCSRTDFTMDATLAVIFTFGSSSWQPIDMKLRSVKLCALQCSDVIDVAVPQFSSLKTFSLHRDGTIFAVIAEL